MLQRLHGNIGDQRGRGRRADLVGHHPQRITLGTHAQHGAQEIRAVRGIDPGRAEDQVATTGRTYGILTISLAGAIYTQRRSRLIFAVRRGTLAIEHIVGGVMHERHAMRRTPSCDHPRSLRIGRKGRIDLLFGTVDRSVGRGVDHDRRLQTIQQGRQAVRLAEIGGFAGAAIRQSAAARGRNHLAQRRQHAQQLLADLAIAAEHQHRHAT